MPGVPALPFIGHLFLWLVSKLLFELFRPGERRGGLHQRTEHSIRGKDGIESTGTAHGITARVSTQSHRERAAVGAAKLGGGEKREPT